MLLPRSDFLIDPDVIFLNHGSFGACPRPVYEAWQAWQRRLELQPVRMLGREIVGLLRDAIAPLADYVGVPSDDMIFVQNATTGVNLVAFSLTLAPGDEVLGTDHEYGACSYAWQEACRRAGAHYIQQPVPLPLPSPEAFTELIWQGVTARTRVIYLSHITSPTGVIFPVAEIVARARERGILTMIDGAHTPAHIPLDLATLAADFYTGNCHKWMCAPKGSGFLYARPEVQPLLTPLPVSWGYPERSFTARHDKAPTRDPSAFLSVPAALEYIRAHDWPAMQAAAHQRLVQAGEAIARETGCRPLSHPHDCGQMMAFALPALDIDRFKAHLYDQHRIEIPVYIWDGIPVMRLSVMGYNTQVDIDHLLGALPEALRDAAG